MTLVFKSDYYIEVVECKYLINENHAYVVCSSSYLSGYELDVPMGDRCILACRILCFDGKTLYQSSQISTPHRSRPPLQYDSDDDSLTSVSDLVNIGRYL
jgi:hypothetical protein